jgi:hypothetical protein
MLSPSGLALTRVPYSSGKHSSQRIRHHTASAASAFELTSRAAAAPGSGKQHTTAIESARRMAVCAHGDGSSQAGTWLAAGRWGRRGALAGPGPRQAVVQVLQQAGAHELDQRGTVPADVHVRRRDEEAHHSERRERSLHVGRPVSVRRRRGATRELTRVDQAPSVIIRRQTVAMTVTSGELLHV